MWRQDVFGNAALKSESGDGTEIPTEGDLLTPEPVLQQRGWLNWLSLGMLGAADNHSTGQIFPQEIIKVCLSKSFVQGQTVNNKGYSEFEVTWVKCRSKVLKVSQSFSSLNRCLRAHVLCPHVSLWNHSCMAEILLMLGCMKALALCSTYFSYKVLRSMVEKTSLETAHSTGSERCSTGSVLFQSDLNAPWAATALKSFSFSFHLNFKLNLV